MTRGHPELKSGCICQLSTPVVYGSRVDFPGPGSPVNHESFSSMKPGFGFGTEKTVGVFLKYVESCVFNDIYWSESMDHGHGTVCQPILEHQIRPSAPSSVISRPTCFSSSLRCCLQAGSAPFVRRRCDCLASSAPFTNIQTYLLTYLCRTDNCSITFIASYQRMTRHYESLTAVTLTVLSDRLAVH